MKWNTNKDNVVLDGYDVVSYFHADQPCLSKNKPGLLRIIKTGAGGCE